MSRRGGVEDLALVLAALLALLVSAVATTAITEDFHGHSVLRVSPAAAASGGKQDALLRFLEDHPDLDVWRRPNQVEQSVDVRVNPEQLDNVRKSLEALKLQSRVIIPNLQELVSEQERQMSEMKRANPAFGWDNYYPLDEIYEWLKSLEKTYPNVSTVVKGGETHERRPILGVKIKFGEGKPIAFLEAGIHAREWISPATATFLINEILTNSTASFRKIVESFEWHIFPVTNPDGYVYTFAKTGQSQHCSLSFPNYYILFQNRMWRKNRSGVIFCKGVDLNRNWPFHWEAPGTLCTETFPGFSPESEKETRGLRRYLDGLQPRGGAVLYVSLHSFSQLLMFPWSYTKTHAPNYDRLNEISGRAVAAVRARYGTEYTYGAIADTIYVAYGSTLDYAYSKGAKYSFVFELRDKGQFGFMLPTSQIRGTGEETVDGIAVIAEEVLRDIGQ